MNHLRGTRCEVSIFRGNGRNILEKPHVHVHGVFRVFFGGFTIFALTVEVERPLHLLLVGFTFGRGPFFSIGISIDIKHKLTILTCFSCRRLIVELLHTSYHHNQSGFHKSKLTPNLQKQQYQLSRLYVWDFLRKLCLGYRWCSRPTCLSALVPF